MLRTLLQAWQIRRSSIALRSAANNPASTHQMQLVREAVNELRENPPYTLSPNDEAVLTDILEHPEDYAHLHPQHYSLADVVAVEMEIQTAVARLIGKSEEVVHPSPQEVEFIAEQLRRTTDTREPGTNLTDSTEYRKLRGLNEE
jgi:hypothetical protein